MTKSLRDRLKGMDAQRVQEWKADLESAEKRTYQDTDSAEKRIDAENGSKNCIPTDLSGYFDAEKRD
jgi:hypothetical protein